MENSSSTNEPTTNALAACPFCGESVVCHHSGPYGHEVYQTARIKCKCGVEIAASGPGCVEKVTAAWNRRAL